MTTAFLNIDHITMRFGGLVAVSNFCLQMEKGELVGIIGPNGSGKSTVYNMISGFYTPTQGTIFFNGENITGLRPDVVAKKGLVRVFQNARLFKEMSVLDNLLISFHMHRKASFLGSILLTPLYQREERESCHQAMDLLDKLGLKKFTHEPAGKLPFGLQRKLEVARALAAQPTLLLLDEPATGLNVEETDDMMNFILRLKDEFQLTVLLIEHAMRVIMGICPRILVLDHGETIAEGTPGQIQCNQKVIEAYLGVD